MDKEVRSGEQNRKMKTKTSNFVLVSSGYSNCCSAKKCGTKKTNEATR